MNTTDTASREHRNDLSREMERISQRHRVFITIRDMWGDLINYDKLSKHATANTLMYAALRRVALKFEPRTEVQKRIAQLLIGKE